MNSKESAQKWLSEIISQQDEINQKKKDLIEKRDDLFMRLQLLTRIRQQLKTDLIEYYQKELEHVELEIQSLDDLRHDLALLENIVETQFQFS